MTDRVPADRWQTFAFARRVPIDRLTLEGQHFGNLRPMAEAGNAPVVRVECPRGHELAYVRLAVHDGFAGLEATKRNGSPRPWTAVPTVEDATPGASADDDPGMLRVHCRKCAFATTLKLTELIKRYLVAVELNRGSLNLLP